ncbi:MAG: MmgE/PrpD family protein [Betaproteobacteria bacterium]|nr:MmgE/PrpD family protein [Betaproteobacteria bacterium]
MPDSQPTIAELLAEFVVGLAYESIPAAVRERAKLHLLDSVGVAFASSGFEFARKACAGLAALGTGEYGVIGMPAKLPLRDAVLMNGMLVHGLEFDDAAIRGRIHPSAFCVPCALGAGTFAKARGKDMLTAYVAGVECAIRIGMAARGGFSRAGFNAVGIVGAFGSVLTAGKLLGLDPEQLTMAQGIAYSAAAGNRAFAVDDSWTKRFEAGWPAASAITAAMLARQGFVGPRTTYEGKFGVYNTYLTEPAAASDLGAITSRLGKSWEFERIVIKLLPSCFFNHAVINATLALVTRHDLAARDIRSIRVVLPEAAIETVCEPRAIKLAPHDPAAAQFSVYFSAACAAVRRRFTLQEMDADAFDDAEIRALAARVEYAIDPQSNFPAHYSGGVEISTADGRLLAAREDANAGSAEKPLPASAIEEKFLANAQRVMPLQRARGIRDLLLKIDSSDDLGGITARLGAA